VDSIQRKEMMVDMDAMQRQESKSIHAQWHHNTTYEN